MDETLDEAALKVARQSTMNFRNTLNDIIVKYEQRVKEKPKGQVVDIFDHFKPVLDSSDEEDKHYGKKKYNRDSINESGYEYERCCKSFENYAETSNDEHYLISTKSKKYSTARDNDMENDFGDRTKEKQSNQRNFLPSPRSITAKTDLWKPTAKGKRKRKKNLKDYDEQIMNKIKEFPYEEAVKFADIIPKDNDLEHFYENNISDTEVPEELFNTPNIPEKKLSKPVKMTPFYGGIAKLQICKKLEKNIKALETINGNVTEGELGKIDFVEYPYDQTQYEKTESTNDSLSNKVEHSVNYYSRSSERCIRLDVNKLVTKFSKKKK